MERDIRQVEERVFALLMVRLDLLVHRRAPVRKVSAGPARRTARLHFADGTTFIVRSRRAGSSAAVLNALLHGGAVLLQSWRWQDDGLVLTLAVPGRRRIVAHEMVLLGADQPD
ncbi:hypothetical protein GCM10025789_13160 [Tessaracoccus lubricantis]|uniref:Uncharacterized protein n=1 Tax=Tessaracoccus lubricantis TaxID=545543 RepID=A0ABP9F9M8_9ACTN